MVEARGMPMPPLCTLQGCCNLPYLVGGLASELTPIVDEPCHPPGDPCHSLGGNSTNPGISYGETNDSVMENEIARERERESEKRKERGMQREGKSKRGLTRCDFQRALSSLFWGAALAGFNGDAFDFFEGNRK